MKQNFKIINYTKNCIINQYLDKTTIEDFKKHSVKYIQISDSRNISAFMIIKQNDYTINASQAKSKNPNYFTQVVITGLRQPTNSDGVDIKTYSALADLIKFKPLDTLDICYDGLKKIDMLEKGADNIHKYIFRDYFVNNKDVKLFFTTFFINNPSNPIKDVSNFVRAIVYDKYMKETQFKGKILDDSLKNWKRIEATISVKSKLKDFIIDDYLADALSFADKYFNIDDFSLDYITMQLELMIDKRTHKGKIIL